MANEQERSSQDVLGLIRSSGLRLSEDEEPELETLIQRFEADRSVLAGIELGELEPAIVFMPLSPGEDSQ